MEQVTRGRVSTGLSQCAQWVPGPPACSCFLSSAMRNGRMYLLDVREMISKQELGGVTLGPRQGCDPEHSKLPFGSSLGVFAVVWGVEWPSVTSACSRGLTVLAF